MGRQTTLILDQIAREIIHNRTYSTIVTYAGVEMFVSGAIWLGVEKLFEDAAAGEVRRFVIDDNWLTVLATEKFKTLVERAEAYAERTEAYAELAKKVHALGESFSQISTTIDGVPVTITPR